MLLPLPVIFLPPLPAFAPLPYLLALYIFHTEHTVSHVSYLCLVTLVLTCLPACAPDSPCSCALFINLPLCLGLTPFLTEGGFNLFLFLPLAVTFWVPLPPCLTCTCLWAELRYLLPLDYRCGMQHTCCCCTPTHGQDLSLCLSLSLHRTESHIFPHHTSHFLTISPLGQACLLPLPSSHITPQYLVTFLTVPLLPEQTPAAACNLKLPYPA